MPLSSPEISGFSPEHVTPERIADTARSVIEEAALPGCYPGEPVKAMLHRAARELGVAHERGAERMIRAAWHREAGCWSAKTFLALLARRDLMRARRVRGAPAPDPAALASVACLLTARQSARSCPKPDPKAMPIPVILSAARSKAELSY